MNYPSPSIYKVDGPSSEAYESTWSLHGVEARSTTELGCRYAESQLSAAVRADHLGEFLGIQAPRFSLRPVWFRDLTAESLGETCRFLVDCGYNALVVETSIDQKLPLYIIQKVTDPSQASPYADYLLLEFTPASHELLESEAAERQIAEWERRTKNCGLIVHLKVDSYSAACRQAEWLPELCDRCGDRTILAFSAVAGPTASFDQPLHPVWKRLREIPLASATPLMPLVNAGCIQLGEGLWPVSCDTHLDEILAYMSHHHFSGMMCLAATVPPSNGLAACNLWTAGQAQWQGRAAKKLVETWLQANRPDLNASSLRLSFIEADGLLRMLNLLRSGNVPIEEARTLCDLIVGKLSYLGRQLVPQCDYLRYFCRDAWCLLVDALNHLRLPLTPVLLHADLCGGFWTEIGTAHKVIIRSTPQPKLDDPKMIRLFHDNR